MKSALERFVAEIVQTAGFLVATHNNFAGKSLGNSHQPPDLYQISYYLEGEERIIAGKHHYADVIKAGFDCIQPLEARAGNDVRKLKKEYGKDIAFFGNINMDVLARGRKEKIEEEVVSKVKITKEGGGYIFHSDHSVPPTASFESYRLAVDLARKHGGY